MTWDDNSIGLWVFSTLVQSGAWSDTDQECKIMATAVYESRIPRVAVTEPLNQAQW